MTAGGVEGLREPIEALLAQSSRINSAKPQRYWYPLSVASYGVEEVLGALDSLCSFRTTMWDKTAAFEEALARSEGAAEAVMVNSGSSADLLVALALVNPAQRRLDPGDEVLVPAVTWPTQLWSLLMAGLTIRLVDADPRTFNVDLDDLEAKVGPRTRAVSLVHLLGNPCDMDRVVDICRRHDLLLVEDCCEALGASWRGGRVGTFGVASAFSFFFSHHMTTMEGGAVLTDDADVAELLRLLRAHGWARNLKRPPDDLGPGIDPRYSFLNWGLNVRPTELQAAFGLVQLERLPGFLEVRQRRAATVVDALAPIADRLRLMEVPDGADCSWFALPFVVAPGAGFTRAELVAHLEEVGVETRPVVAGNLTRHPVRDLFPALGGQHLPGADVLHDRGLYLGLHPMGDDGAVDRLVEVLGAFVHRA